MEKETTDLEKFEGRSESLPATNQTPNLLMQMTEIALKSGQSLETVKELWQLKIDDEKYEAKKAYDKDKAKLAAEKVVIVKDMKNKQYNSKYSSIDALVNGTRPLLGKHHFSHAWSYPDIEGKMISVTCTLTHKDGHSESVTIPGPPDSSGSKNPLQEMKSTRTYLKKESYEAVTGFVSSENNCDDDGNASGNSIKKISEEQLANLKAYCESHGLPADMTLQKIAKNAYTLDKIENLRADWYENCIGWIDNAAKPKKQ